ncbi:Polynucleotide adenylyltransferase [Bertholletia excelsa]
MTISTGLGFGCRTHCPLQHPLRHCVRKLRYSCAVAVQSVDEPESLVRENIPHDSDQSIDGGSEAPEWKKMSSTDLGISNSMIAKPTRMVLNGLKRKGFDAYLVGGCVRDLILKRTPKDFDIITSAELKEASISFCSNVLRTFSRSAIIGRRFPICHVHIEDKIVEVSSFSTRATKFHNGSSYGTPIGCDEKEYLRWRNCLQRDFTINGLMFDPFAKVVYDYLGGLADIRKAKVRTVVCANVSFVEDCARILRAIRIAARLGFRFTRETAQSIKNLSYSVLKLDRGRILLEINYMLAYGSAEASLRLLWKFGLLEVLLPIQAAYFVQQGFRRRDKRSNMLLSLFSNMDKLLAPDRPCHSSLWVGILAFHKELSDRPRDPLVVAAFGLAVHNGGDMLEALDIARRITTQHETSFHELLQSQYLDSKTLKDEVLDLAASVKSILTSMTDEYFVSQAMSMYSKAPYSDLVFIPLELYLRACRIFECVREGKEKGFIPKQGSKIDYKLLAMGSLQEVRHVFARIVFDTVYPLNLSRDHIPYN